MLFCPRTSKLEVLKFPKLGLSRLWRPITFWVDLWLRWGLKQSCILCWNVSNDMWYAICMQVNQGDFQLLMVGSQIGILTFSYNLCFKHSNGTCEHILDICVSGSCKWYKELFNPMNLDPYDCLLKIWKFIKIPIPKVRAHLEVCGFIPSHSLTFLRVWNVILGLHSRLASLQALALVASPRLGSQHNRTWDNKTIITWDYKGAYVMYFPSWKEGKYYVNIIRY